MKFKLNTLGYFSAFITALVSDYSDKLIAGMVRKGYAVRACLSESDTDINVENGSSTLIVFSLYNEQEGVTTDKVHKDLVDLIMEERMYVHSVIITESVNSSFAGTNIILPKKPQPPSSPPIPPENLRKMN